MSEHPLRSILTVLVFFFFSSSICQAIDGFEEEGMRLYKIGEYSDAAKRLGQCVSNSPQNATAHYLLGNCLLHLNHADQADKEFRTCLGLTKDPTLTSYCKKGIETCSYALAKSREADDLEGTIRRISNQAFLHKSITDENLSASNKAAMDDTKERIKILEIDKENTKYKMETKTYSDGKGYTSRYYTDQEIQAAMDSFDERIQAVKASANKASKTYLEVSEKANKDVDDSVKSLEDSLRLSPNAKGERLLPLGTNLYVRNYSVLDAQSQRKPPEQELAATQELLLLDEHKKNGIFNTTITPQTKSTNSWRTSTSSVYGKLLENNSSK